MIKLGDVVSVLREYPDNHFDAVLCDPPYGLAFMGKRWDYDVPSVELWREVLRVCKPGAPLLAAFGTRTYHRGVVRIEDSGWEIRDCIAWMYGSGFPKSLDVSKAIDNASGDSPEAWAHWLRARREACGMTRDQVAEHVGCTPASVRDWEEGRARRVGAPIEHILPSPQYRAKLRDLFGYPDDERAIVGDAQARAGDGTVVGLGHSGTLRAGGNTPLAAQWSGYGTALKPAHEPYVLARKPLDGTVAQNVARWGVGALAIDACRIEGDVNTSEPYLYRGDNGVAMGAASERLRTSGGGARHDAGRWPANVILDEVAGAALDEQSGNRPGMSSGGKGRRDASMFGVGGVTKPETIRGDSGGASRFFYCAKASRAERDAGCEDLPAKTRAEATGRDEDTAGAKNPRAGAGSIGGSRNHHPTVKPLALCEYLARLILPPKPGVLLVPFAGSGSEVVGALRAGWPEVVGIEREAEYVEIARRRVAHALATPAPKPKQAKSAKPRRPRAPKTNPKPLVVVRRLEQIPLFP